MDFFGSKIGAIHRITPIYNLAKTSQIDTFCVKTEENVKKRE